MTKTEYVKDDKSEGQVTNEGKSVTPSKPGTGLFGNLSTGPTTGGTLFGGATTGTSSGLFNSNFKFGGASTTSSTASVFG